MTQASDLGGIANQLAAFYRARVNVNLQALATQHYGSSEPAIMYPNMVWFDSGTGYVKLRNPTNSAWATVGTIGPPMKWTNVDIPRHVVDHRRCQADAQDGRRCRLGDDERRHDRRRLARGALTRANPDTQALFTLLWNNVAISSASFTPPARPRRPAAAPRRRPTGRRIVTSPCPRRWGGCSRTPDGVAD